MQGFDSETVICRGMETDALNRRSTENTCDIVVPHSHDSDRINRLIRYNEDLEVQMDLIRLNESFLESKLEELESILSASDSIERYSLSRLTELTLFCAGNYANNNCITEVGNLMINPRLILIHIKGEQFPVKKERYTPLSIQFANRATENCSVFEWLKFNTIIETVKEPILPYLLKLLKETGCSREYIDSVKKQMNMIVELLSYLSMARIPKETNIEDWKSSLEKNDRIMMEDLFYRFDKTVFYDLGEKIRHRYEIGEIHVS
ncbi:MAG: hypothetical protein GY737_31935 [Desulfobacteraceae bacterium]|nr:hypothetical protein [Desulfobacteraceae bacterium]